MNPQSPAKTPVAPGINDRFPFRRHAHWRAFLRDPLGFQMRAREEFGDVFRFRIGPVVVHFVYHPEHVRWVLTENQRNYQRGWHFRLLRRLFGDNLTVSEGAFWLRQRRMVQPAFSRQRLSEYAEVMVQEASDLVSRWRGMAAEGKPIDARHEMSRVSLAVLSRTLFDRDISHQTDELGATFSVLGKYFEYRFNHPVSAPPTWVPTPTNRRFKQAVATINRIVMDIVQQRSRDAANHRDLLSMLVQARDEETGERMSEDQLRSEVLNFLLAGHESTATALAWTWYLLALHAETRQRVREEIKSVIGDRPPQAADAPQLNLTRGVVQEAMRLYPPIWLIPRQAVARDEIGGFRIPARSTILLCPYVTHRHPAFWDSPEVFDPDRFTAERMAGRPKEAFIPFLSGPHQCIGNDFALLTMQLVVACVLQEFDVTMQPGQVIKPVASLGLWPDGPVRLTIKRRDT